MTWAFALLIPSVKAMRRPANIGISECKNSHVFFCIIPSSGGFGGEKKIKNEKNSIITEPCDSIRTWM